MKNFKKMLCVLLAVITVLSSLLIVPTSAKAKPIKTTQITKLTSTKDTIKLTWKTVSGVTGYQIQISPDNTFKKKLSYWAKKSSISTKTIKDFKSDVKVYCRIRAYKKSGDAKRYSKWSSVKSIKTKKKTTVTINGHTYTVCTNNNNHSMICGNIGGWYNSREEFYNAYSEEADYWNDLLDKEIISYEEYVLKVPRGYECWSCGFCGKWTGNMLYDGPDHVSIVKSPPAHLN